MAGATLKGITTIVWGATNMMGSPAGAIIESGQVTPKNGEPIEIEDNGGFAAVEVLLDDGFNGKFSCLYDSSKTWPTTGQNVTVNLPNYAGNNGGTVGYLCLVVAMPEITEGRKKEAMINYNVTYRPNITNI